MGTKPARKMLIPSRTLKGIVTTPYAPAAPSLFHTPPLPLSLSHANAPSLPPSLPPSPSPSLSLSLSLSVSLPLSLPLSLSLSARTGLAVKDADEVREVVEDGEVVLDDDDVVVLLQQAADRLGGVDALLHVQVRRRLVEPARGRGGRRGGPTA